MGRFARVVGAIGLVVSLGAAFTAPASAATAGAPASGAKAAKLFGSVTVSAAASLTEAFTKMGEQFEKQHEGTTVTLNFAASSALAAQITAGAPADAFASADGSNMQKVVASGDVTATPVDFAANLLTIVVKKGNPEGVRSLADLADLGVISLCAPSVPCGKYANQMLTHDGIDIPSSKITLGQDVKTTLAAVSTGDADAALVYVTDAKSARGTVTQVKIPASLNALAIYSIAPVAASENAALAKAWVDYVLSPKGQQTLSKFGFLPVPET